MIVSLPDVDKGQTDPRNIIFAVISSIEDGQFYKIGNKYCTLSQLYTRNQFDVYLLSLIQLDTCRKIGNCWIPSRVAKNDRIPSRGRSNYVRIPSWGWINYVWILSWLVLDGINISSIFIELQEASLDTTRIIFLYYRNYLQ